MFKFVTLSMSSFIFRSQLFRILFIVALPRNLNLNVLEYVETHGMEVGVMVVAEK